MRAIAYVYDSAAVAPHVETVLDLLDGREEAVEIIDVDDREDPEAAEREAMLTVKAAVRVGTPPAALFDGDGRPDFSTGALVTEADTGRRSLHVGAAAAEALRSER